MANASIQVSVSRESMDSLMALHAAGGKAMASGQRTADGRFVVRLDPDVYEGLVLVDPDIDRAISRVVVSASQERHDA